MDVEAFRALIEYGLGWIIAGLLWFELKKTQRDQQLWLEKDTDAKLSLAVNLKELTRVIESK